MPARAGAVGVAVTLRPARAGDAEFAFRVEKETMRDYAIATWGSWPEDQVRSRAEKNVRAGETRIVELAGVPIGTQLVERTPEHIRLLQLFLLPAHQRQGIGSELVQRLVREAGEGGVPLRLRVLKVNPARALYQRIGFAVVSVTAEHLYMEYVPARAR